MSQKSSAWFKFDPLKNPSDAFVDYLEGYASALDIFPVCSRSELQHEDISAVLENFWRLSADLSQIVEECKSLRRINIRKSSELDVEAEGRK